MGRKSTQGNNTEQKPKRRDPKDFITPRQLAERSGIGLMGVYGLLESGQLPGVRVGRRWYVPMAAYEDCLANWAVQGKPLIAA